MHVIKKFVLASESPRRQKLLFEAGFLITVFPVKVSETLKKNLTAQEQIQVIAHEKFLAARHKWNQTNGQQALILTADTMVVLDGQALGKPADSADAINTLLRLSGHEHQVITAVCLGLSDSTFTIEKTQTTSVFFRLISRQEAAEYVATGEPMDKAGSYAIQGIGSKFVDTWSGDFDNVVGLPVNLVKEICKSQNWQLPFHQLGKNEK